MKNTKQYFSHDSGAKDDPKIVKLIEDEGLEAYGIYWILIETLRDSENFKASIHIIPRLARAYNTQVTKINSVINLYNLFVIDIDNELFYSESLLERMGKMIELKNKRSEAGKKGNLVRWGSQSDSKAIAKESQSDRKLSQPIANKIKLNKTKLNEIKEKTIYPFSDFWNDYDKKIGKAKAEKKYSKISEADRSKIKETLPNFLATITDKQFQPHPITYLNNERWNDELNIKQPQDRIDYLVDNI